MDFELVLEINETWAFCSLFRHITR